MTDFTLDLNDYLGLLDDVVWRYPWKRQLAAPDIEALLVERFLFGGRMLVNDGYLVSHPALLAQVASVGSLLHLLISHGHIRVASARFPISASIMARAESGVATQATLVASEQWPAIAAGLDRLADQPGATVSWPRRDLTQGFTTLVRRWIDTLQKTPEARTLVALAERFFESIANDPRAPRTKWEALIRTGVADLQISREQALSLMQQANQLYHINFAAAMVLTTGETMTASTWLDNKLMNFLGSDLGRAHVIEHSMPIASFDSGRGLAFVEAALADARVMETRAHFVSGWRDPQVAADYADALHGIAPGGPVTIRPPTSFEPSTARIDLWAPNQAFNGTPARIMLSSDHASSMLGDGINFVS